MAGQLDIRQGLIEAASALGMPPDQLATIISFESGFNPNVWGGAGGRHYGLIQFGPAERAAYGVKVGDPSSQLGTNGAIVRYFRDRGWKPGMSMLDAYSIVNAGAPGKYNASDTAAGGTRGDVYDKVENQFGPHWQKARQFLSGADRGVASQSPYTIAGPEGKTAKTQGPIEGRHPPNPTVSADGTVKAGAPGYGVDYTGGVAGAETPVAAADEKQPKTWRDKLHDVGDAIGDIDFSGMASPYKGAAVPAQPAAANFTATLPQKPQQAAAVDPRQQLALIMQRLNQGVLF